MAGIQASITLRDRMSAVLSKSAATSGRLTRSLKQAGTAGRSAGAGVEQSFTGAGTQIEASRRSLQKFTDTQKQMASSARAADSAWSALGSRIAGVLAAVGAKRVLGLSDTMTQTAARLNLMNDGKQSAGELQSMIFASAQRSRGDYLATADAVSKMGLLAGDSFKSSGEIVAFMEQVNKQFTIAGTSAEEQKAALLQLTQAMGSGVLRGEELNSIFKQAPTMIQSIAKYLDIPVGQIRKLAEEGLLTAETVKAALLSTAEETNAKFERMPKTFAQVWTSVKNQALLAFQPALNKLSELANSPAFQQFVNSFIQTISVAGNVLALLMDGVIGLTNIIADSGNVIQPLLIAAAIVLIPMLIAHLWGMAAPILASAAAWLAMHLPILAIILLIAGLISALSMMGVSFEDICGGIGGILYGLYAFGYNLVADIWNFIAVFAEFFANVFNDPIGSICRLFIGLADFVLGVIETIADALDACFGSNMADTVSGWRNDMQAWADDQFGEAAIKIDRFEKLDTSETAAQGFAAGKGFGEKLTAMADSVSGIADNFGEGSTLGNIGSVGEIKSDVNIAEEDIRLLKDVAELRYVQNFVTLTPTVAMSASISQSVDVNEVASEVERRLEEEFVSAAEGVYN